MKIIKKIITVLVFSAPLIIQASTIKEKNDNIEVVIEQAMDVFQVPGVAVAIIKDNKVVMSKGFGVIEQGNNIQVTSDTLFGIASNTKAMTAALLAGLVDEGKLTWRTKVIDVIPEFQLPDPYVTREFTIIDLLSHNSGLGLGAGDLMIWPQTTLTNADVIKGLKHLPQVSSFRSEFAYDNLMYVIAGEIIAKLTTMTWQEAIQSRLFTPLGMKNTYPTFSQIPKNNTNVARAHVPLEGKLNVVGGNFLEKFTSAGSVASSVNDMALWLKVQLNQGLYINELNKEEKIYTTEQSRAMWQSRTILPVTEEATKLDKTHFSAYGLGWFLKDYQGIKLIHHSGGILGMVSKVAMVPEENLAMVVLTNQQSGYAFNAIYLQILNEYLGLPKKDWVTYFHDKQQVKKEKEANRLANAIDLVNKNAAHSLRLQTYAQTYTDSWYGDIKVHYKNNQLTMQFTNTAELKGTLEHYQYNTFIVRWDDRSLEADAFVNFHLNEVGEIEYVTMKAVSKKTDFSFDFHDLKLIPNRSK
jgi:CubicO group peptidase (beta-lactamase class C family)